MSSASSLSSSGARDGVRAVGADEGLEDDLTHAHVVAIILVAVSSAAIAADAAVRGRLRRGGAADVVDGGRLR